MRDDRGDVTVEAVILLPLLFLLFAASWVYFDALQQKNVSQKANYTLGDMLSRETVEIDPTYMDNAHGLLRLLTRAQADDETALRVTVVSYDSGDDAWTVEWSMARGGQAAMASGGAPEESAALPQAQNGDQLILVETWDSYTPAFNVGLTPQEFATYSFTRPRYAPQLAAAE
ncbi:hypothetical protein J1C49_03730 [Cognatishimia sp. F0-27]|nr:hypothetical protein [Cognatishimia sp. F0-27]